MAGTLRRLERLQKLLDSIQTNENLKLYEHAKRIDLHPTALTNLLNAVEKEAGLDLLCRSGNKQHKATPLALAEPVAPNAVNPFE